MNYPKSVMEAVKAAVDNHPDSIPSAAQEAEQAIRQLPELGDLMAKFLRTAVLELVCAHRHQVNVQIKRETGQFGGPAKINLGESPEILRVYKSAYEYHIAGTVLGLLYGKDLAGAAAKEQGMEDGHRINKLILLELERIVPAGEQVRNAIPERRLRALFTRAQRMVKGEGGGEEPSSEAV